MDDFQAFATVKGKQLWEATTGKPKPPEILNELMTRRDAFAAAALTGLLSHGTDEVIQHQQRVYAIEAFEWADAMLEVRDS